MGTLRRRLLGLAFFVVIALFLGGTIMKFQGVFSDIDEVTLKTDSAGNSLSAHADVKARGMVVGTVKSIKPADDGSVDVVLGIEPDKISMLPSDTTGRILPKTLFGERYVALQVPENPTSTVALESGSQIKTDSSGNAKEVQDLFDRLLPVLQAVPPQDLNVTLTSLSQALQGRGEQLGATLEDLNTIFTKVNANMPELQGTLRGLSSFSQTYSKALPDVIDALDNLRITGNTLVEKKGDLSTLISTLGTASTDTTAFLRTNKADLIDLFVGSKDYLWGLANQSPVFGCTFKNFAALVPESRKIVGEGTPNPGVRVGLQFVNPRGRYLPNQDEPRNFEVNRGPICYKPPTNGRPFPQYPGGGLADGSYQPPSRNAGPRDIPSMPRAQFSTAPTGNIKATSPFDDPDYRAQLQVIYGGATGVEPGKVPSWVTLLGGTALQGAQVTIK